MTAFVVLVFLLGVPFYLAGPAIGSLVRVTRADVPASALIFVCPALTAALLVYWRGGARGVRAWLGTALRRPSASGPARVIVYPAAVLLMPLVVVVSYLIMRWLEMPLPRPHLAWSAIPVPTLAYLLSALFEELGWTGYALEPLQRRWGGFWAGVVIGAVWAVWHVVPYRQLGHGPAWIAWQGLYSVGLRLILVWLYNNTGRSLLAPVVGHASSNVAWSLFPNSGSHYNPMVTALVTTSLTAVVVLLHDRYVPVEHRGAEVARATSPPPADT